MTHAHDDIQEFVVVSKRQRRTAEAYTDDARIDVDGAVTIERIEILSPCSPIGTTAVS